MSSESNQFKLPQEKMDFFHKIWWRLKFLFSRQKGLNWEIKKLFLFTRAEDRTSRVINYLIKKGVIEFDYERQLLKFKNFSFFYDAFNDETHLFTDFLSIFGNESPELGQFAFSQIYKMEGPYEIGDVKMAPGDNIIDVGANIGLFSVLASRKVGTAGRIFAFEPVKVNRDLLNKNLTSNNITNVQVEPAALGRQAGKLELIKPDLLGSSCSGYFTGNFPKETVEQWTLDDYVKVKNIGKVDFIKADIEGMERDLILGAKETIIKFKPRLSICIYHRADDPAYIESLIKSYVPEYKIIKTDKKLYAAI